MTETVTGVSVPDSPLASEATALLREAGTPLLLSDGLSCGSRGGRNHQTSIGTGNFLGTRAACRQADARHNPPGQLIALVLERLAL